MTGIEKHILDAISPLVDYLLQPKNDVAEENFILLIRLIAKKAAESQRSDVLAKMGADIFNDIKSMDKKNSPIGRYEFPQWLREMF